MQRPNKRPARPRRALALVSRPDHRALIADDRSIEGSVEVAAVAAPSRTPPKLSKLLDENRLDRDERAALAEIAFNLHRNGRTRLARVVFEGLALLDPKNAYAHLGAGLTNDVLGERRAAESFYDRARRIDPTDARADINRAELRIQAGDRATAKKLLARALVAAERSHDDMLIQKARAMQSLLSTRGARR